MAVEPQIPRIVYLANGSQTAFPISFPYAAQSDVQVWVGLTDHEVLQTLGSAYTITGASPNGVVTFSTPVPVNLRVALVRLDPLRQPLDTTNTGTIYPQTIVASLDRVERQVQDISERTDRALILRPASNFNVPQLFLDEPAPDGILRFDSTGTRVLSDAQLGSILVNARDQALAAAAQAVTAAAAALNAALSASTDAASAAASAALAANSAAAAVAAAQQATAARDYVESIAQKATYGLGLIGLANNLTQLLYTIVPFLRPFFKVFEDWGWIDVAPSVTEDDGWVCPGSGGSCIDWGLVDADATEFEEWGLITDSFTEALDYGLIADEAICTGEPVVCSEDLGWVNSVIPIDPDEVINLPIMVPNPCPVIFSPPTPPVPPGPPTPDSDAEC